MSAGIVSKFLDLEYKVTQHPNIEDLPKDLQPAALTEDGVLIEILPDEDNIEDALFTAYGKLLTLDKYLKTHGLNTKFSVLLVLSAKEFKKLHPKLRRAVYSDLPFIVI